MTDSLRWSWRAGGGRGLSRRQFLRVATFVAGGALVTPGALSRGRALAGPPAEMHTGRLCGEPLQAVLDVAATLEALAVTFYYHAVTTPGGFFVRLPSNYQGYLRAALDQEWFHYNDLGGRGATPLSTAFYFPAGTFGFNGLPLFLAALDTLETASIGAHLASVRQFGELDEPVLAEVAGQILAVEAGHRVLGREIAQNSPPPPNDLCFERATLDCVSQSMDALRPFLQGGSGSAGPFDLPGEAEVAAAVGGFDCSPVPLAVAATCAETVAEVLDIAATAEALGITFYERGIRGGFFPQLSEPRQWYLQAALDEERHHLDFLQANGAVPATTQFFFPPTVFDDQALFLEILDRLENAFIGAYLAAMQRFARLGQPLLAEIAGQILGIEAEHRVLGRVIAEAQPPNDLCLERAGYACLAEALADLAPFLEGGPGFTRQATLPTDAAIDAAVDRFGCTPVPTAAHPRYRVYFPEVMVQSE